jgi:hypothetical protein
LDPYSIYQTEADVCYDAGAYLASCIMLGATMEGYLVILTIAFPEEAQQSLRHLKKTKQIGRNLGISSLLNWDLGQLLLIARQANWLPSNVSNSLSGDEIRKLRNLVHPGRLVQDRKGETITKQELNRLHATCLEIYVHLSQAVACTRAP